MTTQGRLTAGAAAHSHSAGRPTDPPKDLEDPSTRAGRASGAARRTSELAEQGRRHWRAERRRRARPREGAGGNHGPRTHPPTQHDTHTREGAPRRHLQPQRRRRPQATAEGVGEGGGSSRRARVCRRLCRPRESDAGRADRRLLSVLCLQFSENYLHSLSRVFGRSVSPPICRVERARRAPEFHSVDVAHQSLLSTFRRRSCQHIQVGVIQTKSSLPQLSPRIRAMAEHAQAFRTPLVCLLLCLLLLLSSPQRATSKHHNADDDRGTFSGGQARRTLSGTTMPEGLCMPSHNSSNSSRAGAAFCRLLSLQILDLSNNQFTGELPDCWWNLLALPLGL